MSDTQTKSIKRRDVLKGAAALAGAVALENSAVAQVLGSTATISVAYFDGTRLIPADRLPKGDGSLEQVVVSMKGHNKGQLHGIDAQFEVRQAKGSKLYPYKAWEPGSVASEFVMPVSAKNGVRLSVSQRTTKSTATVPLQLQVGTAKGAKLREGTYVIVAGNINWNGYRFEQDDPNGPVLSAGGRPTSLGYVLLDIQRS